MIILRPLNLRWIKGAVDDPADLCAHGDVEFRIGKDVLLDATNGKSITVSAAGLYLLRTLLRPHTKKAPVCDHLFPCCGFTMCDIAGDEDVVVLGCPGGEDFEVLHDVKGAEATIRSGEGREWRIGAPDWRDAVFGFADQVSEFYASSSPKRPYDEEDARGFRKFGLEWARRRGEPFGQARRCGEER